MSYKAITIYTPSGSTPHISAEDDAFIYNALLQGRSGILGDLDCERVDDNTVRLSGGGAVNRGYVAYIPDGDTADLTIASGTQGMRRYDLVVSQFTRGGGDTADAHIFRVLQGTASASPADPTLTTSELAASGDVNQVALFRVVIDGVSIVDVLPVDSAASEIPYAVECSTASYAASSVSSQVAQSASVCTGNSATATKLASPRTISLSGDASGSASFDGSANASLSATVNKIRGKNVFIQSGTPSGAASGDLWFWRYAR